MPDLVKSREDFERIDATRDDEAAGATKGIKQIVFAAACFACNNVADETQAHVDYLCTDLVMWIVARRKRSVPTNPDEMSDPVSKAAFMLAYMRPAFALGSAFRGVDDVKSIITNALLRTKLSTNNELLRSQNKNVDDVKVEIVMSMVQTPDYYDRATLGTLMESLYDKYEREGAVGIMTKMPTSVLMAMWSVGSTPISENKDKDKDKDKGRSLSYLKKVFGASFSFYFYGKEDKRMREFVRAFGSGLTHKRALTWNSNYGNENGNGEGRINGQYLHEITPGGERKIPVGVVGDKDVFGRKGLDDTSFYVYDNGNHTTMIRVYTGTGHNGIDSSIVGALSGHRADDETDALIDGMAEDALVREMNAVELDQEALAKYATHSVPSGSSQVNRSFIYARSPVVGASSSAKSMVEEIGDTYIAVIVEAESNNARNVRLCLLVDLTFSFACELTVLALHYAFNEYRNDEAYEGSPKAQYTLYTGHGQPGVADKIADKIKSAMRRVVRPGAAEKMIAEINSARGTTTRSSSVSESAQQDEYSNNDTSNDTSNDVQSISETADGDTGGTPGSDTAYDDRVRLADSFVRYDGPGDSNPQADTSSPGLFDPSNDKQTNEFFNEILNHEVEFGRTRSRGRWGRWV